MVAQITEGIAFDRHGRPFKRRNYLPGILAGLALFLAAIVVWVVVLNRPADVQEAAACNAPPAPADPSQPQLGQQVSRATMTN
ncbi:MAG: LytR family transcriptional regulator, partial [Mycolicibacterium sp.]|nr:LytR family transcriptional regulator [Mycolicibacterium sp.]